MKESTTKRKIIDVASRLFYSQGYNATGINQIIDEADIARASLYKHFPSKHDLLLSYIEEREKLWLNSIHDYMDKYDDPREKILSLFEFRLDSQSSSGFTGCAFNRISSEVERNDLASFELLKRQKNDLRALIRKLVGEIGMVNPQSLSTEQIGDTVFMILEGATNTGTVNKDHEAVRTAREIASKLIGAEVALEK